MASGFAVDVEVIPDRGPPWRAAPGKLEGSIFRRGAGAAFFLKPASSWAGLKLSYAWAPEAGPGVGLCSQAGPCIVSSPTASAEYRRDQV